jgi:cardiolipin synthase
MVIDGHWATLGSTNLDNRSLALNEELNLAIYSREIAGQFQRIFAEDLKYSRRITYEEWKDRGIKSKFLELLAVPLKDQL